MTDQAPNGRFAWILRNAFAMAGLVTMATGTVVFGFLFVIEVFAAQPHQYLGVIFIFLPPVMMLGALLTVFGWYLDRRVRGSGAAGAGIASLFDLGRTRTQQQLLLMAASFSTIFVFSMAVVGYEAYEYTESVEFCGQTCHAVMKPQHEAYRVSAHARVRCAECHIGEGANWHVRSKLSGAYQIYAYLADIYPRPIPTPVESLRPAQDTCEQCHWPAFFMGGRQQTYRYFLSEGDQEPWEIDMLLRIGGMRTDGRSSEGIHWHVDPNNKVQYAAYDEARQEIAWVRVRGADGRERLYTNADNPPDAAMLASSAPRTMDCVDCHSRPAHRYGTPVELVNRALDHGDLSPAMPEIKVKGLELLAASYETEEQAVEAITTELRTFYDQEYPEYEQDHPGAVESATAVLTSLFRSNMFPEMKTRWDSTHDNSSHWVYNGCFRCHAGNMVSAEGDSVSFACTTCHVILGQGIRGTDTWQSSGQGLPFVHPLDQEIIDEPTLCTDCHDGTLGY